MRKYTLSREQFERLRDSLAIDGFSVAGDSGPLAGDGISGSFVYVEPELTLTVSGKPWYISTSLIWEKVDPLVTQAGGAVVE
jgi:hypothetical protein